VEREWGKGKGVESFEAIAAALLGRWKYHGTKGRKKKTKKVSLSGWEGDTGSYQQKVKGTITVVSAFGIGVNLV